METFCTYSIQEPLPFCSTISNSIGYAEKWVGVLWDQLETLTARTPSAEHPTYRCRGAGINLSSLSLSALLIRHATTKLTGKNRGISFSLRVALTSIQSTPHWTTISESPAL